MLNKINGGKINDEDFMDDEGSGDDEDPKGLDSSVIIRQASIELSMQQPQIMMMMMKMIKTTKKEVEIMMNST